MKVLVTGATGLVGAHSALALLAAGHELRLLVRDEALARRYFAQQGYALADVVVADLREIAKVAAALAGCDAVLHAAALVSVDRRRAQEVYDNNLAVTRGVIGCACEAGIRNIVYVSSLAAFFDPKATAIDENSPLSEPKEAYSKSKRDCDEYVRGLQRQGLPVHITYPAAVMGPDDPRLSEANHGLVSMLTLMLPRTSTGIQCVDARDIGLAHRWLLEHPPAADFESARYILGGHYYPWADLRRLLERVTGTRIASPRIPGGVLRFMGALTDLAQAVVPFQTQMSGDAMSLATQWRPASSARFTRTSGLRFRPGEETFADTLRWMAGSGHLPPTRAGCLATAPVASPPRGVA